MLCGYMVVLVVVVVVIAIMKMLLVMGVDKNKHGNYNGYSR